MDSDDKYLEKVKEIVLGSIDLNLFAVFLYGSRARTKHGWSADYDIGVLGHQKFPDKLIFEIKEKIDSSIVPYHVDVVDFYDVDSKFKTVALKDIKIWNHPNTITLD